MAPIVPAIRFDTLSVKLPSPAADNDFARVSMRQFVASRGAGNAVRYPADVAPFSPSLPFRLRLLIAGIALGGSGCNLIIPEISHQPTIHNPFPQLSKVAIVPFFNQSDEPTVDGREFALAYFAELQAVPGFEVVPLGVVEEAINDEQIDLSNPAGVRRLADVLEVDVVVVGAVTDFSPYYPPRCGMRVEWYAQPRLP